MEDEKSEKDLEQGQDLEDKEEGVRTPPVCTCVQDPFATLPPELRPKPVHRDFGLRRVKCPNCGFIYWTNRKTDLCTDCEKKGVKLAEQ